jgi:hypothetical protein
MEDRIPNAAERAANGAAVLREEVRNNMAAFV